MTTHLERTIAIAILIGASSTASAQAPDPPPTAPATDASPPTEPPPAPTTTPPPGGSDADAQPATSTRPTTGAEAPQAPSASRDVPPPAPHEYKGPLAASLGTPMNDAGFFPILFAGEWFISNPGSLVEHNSDQFMTQLNAGFDLYLKQLIGLPGTSIHFVEAMVPSITTQTATDNYFTQAGDVINASASGYVPYKFHLTRLTIEQQLFDDHLFLEIGKGYVNDYVARPDCLNAFMCMSTIGITHKASGFNFPNYSNWFARIGTSITPELKLQAIGYKYDNNASLTNGWELSRDTNYNAALVDAQYTAPKRDRPTAAELMLYYNDIPQTDQLCATCTKNTTNWQAGLLASVMTTLWRPDVTKPRMLQAFASFADTFNTKQTTSPSVGGLLFALDAGLTMRAPFTSRPFDSYSLQLTAVHLTSDEQTYLDNQGYGAPGPTEYSVGASAVFKVFDFVYVSPYVEYLIDANAAFAGNSFVNPNHVLPSDGFGIGASLIVQVAPLLGVTTRPSGYDGRYP